MYHDALQHLRKGDIILYPSDTIWGLGCDATNEKAVQKIYDIKQRMLLKSLVVLVADEKAVLQYVAAPDLAIFDFLEQQKLHQKKTIILSSVTFLRIKRLKSSR